MDQRIKNGYSEAFSKVLETNPDKIEKNVEDFMRRASAKTLWDSLKLVSDGCRAALIKAEYTFRPKNFDIKNFIKNHPEYRDELISCIRSFEFYDWNFFRSFFITQRIQDKILHDFLPEGMEKNVFYNRFLISAIESLGRRISYEDDKFALEAKLETFLGLIEKVPDELLGEPRIVNTINLVLNSQECPEEFKEKVSSMWNGRSVDQNNIEEQTQTEDNDEYPTVEKMHEEELRRRRKVFSNMLETNPDKRVKNVEDIIRNNKGAYSNYVKLMSDGCKEVFFEAVHTTGTENFDVGSFIKNHPEYGDELISCVETAEFCNEGIFRDFFISQRIKGRILQEYLPEGMEENVFYNRFLISAIDRMGRKISYEYYRLEVETFLGLIEKVPDELLGEPRIVNTINLVLNSQECPEEFKEKLNSIWNGRNINQNTVEEQTQTEDNDDYPKVEKMPVEELIRRSDYISIRDEDIKNGGADFCRTIAYAVKRMGYEFRYGKFEKMEIDDIIKEIKEKDFRKSIKIYIGLSQIKDDDFFNFIDEGPGNIPICILEDGTKTQSNVLRDNSKSLFVRENVFFDISRNTDISSALISDILKTGSIYYRKNGYIEDEVFTICCDKAMTPMEAYKFYKKIQEYIPKGVDIELDIDVNSMESIEQVKEIMERLSEESNAEKIKDSLKIVFIPHTNFELQESNEFMKKAEECDEIVSKLGISCSFFYKDLGKDGGVQREQSFFEYASFKLLEDFVVENVPENVPEIDKVLYVTEFLARYIQYNYAELKKGVSGLGRASFARLFTDGYAVCSNYSIFIKSIFDRIGVKCEFFPARTHAYNIVNIEGVPYWYDITWYAGQLRENSPEKIEDSYDILTSDDNFHIRHAKYFNEDRLIGTKEDYPKEKKIESLGRIRKIQEEYRNGQREIVIPDGLPKDSPVVQEMIRAMQGEIIRRDVYGGPVAKCGREDVLKDMRSRLGLLREFSREYEKEKQEGGYVHGS